MRSRKTLFFTAKTWALLAATIFTYLSATCQTAQTEERGRQPNIIVIVSDDIGYHDLGFQGCKDIPTPHLDKLAASGTRFASAYVTGPICGPTRAALLSGRYQQKHSYDGNPGPNQGLNTKESTLAERGESLQLFNIVQDIGETKDLAAQLPDVVAQLTADWKKWDAGNLPLAGRSP